MTTVWLIHVRDPQLNRQALLDDYQQFDAVKRLNKVGSWMLDLNATVDTALLLTQPGWGIEVVRESDGLPLISGPMTTVDRKRANEENVITVSGVDDVIHLADRLVHPQPASAVPPYGTTEHDVRTGTCSTVLSAYVNVNAGPGALAPRRVTGLVLGADPVAGGSVTGRGRWQNLLVFLQELALAGGGLAFDVRQLGTSLEFIVIQPEDKSATVKFSLELGNLASYSYTLAAPTSSYVVCGGGGEGTARTIREGQSSADIAEWRRRIEHFTDRRDTTDVTELDQEIATTLAEAQAATTFSFVPIDLEGMAYLDDYDLGDRVAAVVDDTVTELIREVKVSATPDKSTITPSIGTPVLTDVARLFRRLRSAEQRVLNLERR